MTEQGHEAGQERTEARQLGQVPEQPAEHESVSSREDVPLADSATGTDSASGPNGANGVSDPKKAGGASSSCSNVGADLARMVAELGATVRAHLDGLGRR